MSLHPPPHEYLQANPLQNGVLYYPAPEVDYGPLKLFGENAVVSTVVYADYMEIGQQAAQSLGANIPGWTTGPIEILSPGDFGEETWADFWPADLANLPDPFLHQRFAIQRHLTPPNTSGIRFIFLNTPGIGAFISLVRVGLTPSLIVLQEPGFAGGGNPLGGKSRLWRMATCLGALPEYLFVATDTPAWPGYEQVSSYCDYPGQTHISPRALFRLSEAARAANAELASPPAAALPAAADVALLADAIQHRHTISPSAPPGSPEEMQRHFAKVRQFCGVRQAPDSVAAIEAAYRGLKFNHAGNIAVEMAYLLRPDLEQLRDSIEQCVIVLADYGNYEWNALPRLSANGEGFFYTVSGIISGSLWSAIQLSPGKGTLDPSGNALELSRYELAIELRQTG